MQESENIQAEVEALKVEARRLRTENDILRKEAAFHTEEIERLQTGQCSDTCEFYYA